MVAIRRETTGSSTSDRIPTARSRHIKSCPGLAFAFIPATWVPADRLTIFASESFSFFSVVQSRIHEIWARFFSTTLEDRLSYTPSDCFETFPFPNNYALLESLERAGQSYYEFRAALMLDNNEGFTRTYNRFHDPSETSSNIAQLRELHGVMDRAVLAAYGWTDIQTRCEFVLDYEEEEQDEDSQRKKPWRCRWPDEVRDEVLARLLALNTERAQQGRLSGAAADGYTKNKRQSRGAKRIAAAQSSFQAVKIEE